MTTMISRYEQGRDAANRALDRSTLNATELLAQWEEAEKRGWRAEDYGLAEYAKGFTDTLREFLDEKGT